MKKIVITGALGHIGSRLIRVLPYTFPEAEIDLIDNLSTQRYCSLFNLPKNGKYRFLERDILTDNIDDIMSGADAVIHLAAITDAAGSFAIKDRVEKVNLEGTKIVANACLRTGCALVFLSTTSVYGTQKEVVDETCTAEDLKPQSPYAESKLRAEQFLANLGHTDNFSFVVCRFGTIFGVSPGMRFHTAVNKFVWQACSGEPITVWRTALNQRRPYLDLGDAVRALVFILRRRQFDQSTYNVITTNATVAEIVQTIQSYISDLKIKYVDSEIMNQLSYTVSSERFRKLGFRFKGSLEKAVADSVGRLKNIRSAASNVI